MMIIFGFLLAKDGNESASRRAMVGVIFLKQIFTAIKCFIYLNKYTDRCVICFKLLITTGAAND